MLLLRAFDAIADRYRLYSQIDGGMRDLIATRQLALKPRKKGGLQARGTKNPVPDIRHGNRI
jgi:hypothetical protein